MKRRSRTEETVWAVDRSSSWRTRLRARARAYPRWVTTTFATGILLLAGAGLGLGAVVWRAPSPEAALRMANRWNATPLSLNTALSTSWEWAHGSSGDDSSAARWRTYMEPILPPALCRLSTEPRPEILDPIRVLAVLSRRHDDPAVFEQFDSTLTALAAARAQSPDEEFLRSYNLARAYLALGSASRAVGEVGSGLARHLSDDVLHPVGRNERDWASEQYRYGHVSHDQVASIFAGRYLAGLARLVEGGDPKAAVLQFRRAMNATLYLVPPEHTREGHAWRTPVSLSDYVCTEAGATPRLSSLDAYAGLVAAYMAAPDYQESPKRFVEEMSRPAPPSANDPLGPVILHGQAVAAGLRSGRPSLPQNVLLAASNLQMVHALNPETDPRLEASRAALVLRLLQSPGMHAAFANERGSEPCRMLGPLREALSAPEIRVWTRLDGATPADSVLAALTLDVVAEEQRVWTGLKAAGKTCDGREVPAQLHPTVRSALLRLSGNHIEHGFPGRFEAYRVDLMRAFDGEQRDTALLLSTFRLAQRDHGRIGGRGPRRWFSPQERAARRQGDAWMTAVWKDLAVHLSHNLAAREAPSRSPTPEQRAEAGAQLEALHAAVRLAGLSPADVYGIGDHAALARSAGGFAETRYRVRYHVLSNPVWVVLAGVAFAAAGWLLAILVVACWRYRLVTGSAYADEMRRPRIRTPF
jgi:hypothetical protein